VTDARVQRWITEVDVAAWQVGRGEYQYVPRLAELSDEAIGLAREVHADARAPILDRLRHVEGVIRAAQGDVQARLAELPGRRRAARRYLSTPQPKAP
jgi:hypothetical protein